MDIRPVAEQRDATIDMIRSLKGPPVRRVEPEREKQLSDATRAALLQAAIVGESRIRRLWWLSLGMLPRIVSWREPPRDMPKAEAFETPVRS